MSATPPAVPATPVGVRLSKMGKRLEILSPNLMWIEDPDAKHIWFHSLTNDEVAPVRAAILADLAALKATLAPGASGVRLIDWAAGDIGALRSAGEVAAEKAEADRAAFARLPLVQAQLIREQEERIARGYGALSKPEHVFLECGEVVVSNEEKCAAWDAIPVATRDDLQARLQARLADLEAKKAAKRVAEDEARARKDAEQAALAAARVGQVRAALVEAGAPEEALRRYDATLLPEGERNGIIADAWFAPIGKGSSFSGARIDHDEKCVYDGDQYPDDITEHREEASEATASEFAALEAIRAKAPADAEVTLREVYDSCDKCDERSESVRYIRVRIERSGIALARCYAAAL